MSVAHSKDAIGAVTQLLLNSLQKTTGVAVDVGRPESAAKATGQRFNLFLYRIGFDQNLHGTSLEEGHPAPLWAVLHYLLTAFEEQDSDSVKAQQLLGLGLATLHSINFVEAPQQDVALVNNPEPLRLTFTESDIDALAKLMNGDAFRLSATFQVQPVMIAPNAKPAPEVIQPALPTAEQLASSHSIGPHITQLHPLNIECGQTITVYGHDIENAEWILIGAQQLPVLHSRGGQVSAQMPLEPSIVPGAYPVSVARMMPNRKLRVSNALMGNLLPTISDISAHKSQGKFTMHGYLLGGPSDDVSISLCQHGHTVLQLEVAGSTDQTRLTVHLPADVSLPDGSYQLMLRVNGAQAAQSPLMDWA